MNVNVTIIVQACNFIITYWMLRCFFFKPVIALIDYERTHKTTILDIIDQQQKSLDIQEKERQRRWFLCQEYFKQQYQTFPHTPIHATETIDVVTEPHHELSTDTMHHIIADVGSIIEEKIKHVH
jgi:hypothetical protein